MSMFGIFRKMCYNKYYMENVNRIIALVLGIVFIGVIIFLFVINRGKDTGATVKKDEEADVLVMVTNTPAPTITKKPGFLEQIRQKFIPGYGSPTPTLTPTPTFGVPLPTATLPMQNGKTLGKNGPTYTVNEIPKSGPSTLFLPLLSLTLAAGMYLRRK